MREGIDVRTGSPRLRGTDRITHLASRPSGVGRVGRQDSEVDLLRQTFLLPFKPRRLLFGQLCQLRICGLGLEHRPVFRQVRQGFEVSLAVADQLFEPGIFPG